MGHKIKNTLLWRVGIALVIIIGSVLLFTSTEVTTFRTKNVYDSNYLPINQGWKYEWIGKDERGVVDLPINLKGGKYSELHLSNSLPNADYKDDTLFIRTYEQNIRVLINGNIIYQYGNFNADRRIKSLGSMWHVIQIPEDTLNRDIDIYVMSPYNNFSGMLSNILMGNKSDLILKIVRESISSLVIAGIILFLGVILVVVFFVLKYKKSNIMSILNLGLFAVFSAFWIISESEIAQVFIDKPVLILYISLMSLFLMPIPILLFIIDVYRPRRKKLLSKLAYCFIAFFVVASVLQIFDVVSYLMILPVFHVLLIFCIIVIFYVNVEELVSGNKSIKLFFWGYIILSIFTMYDLWNFYFSELNGLYYKSNFQYAILFLIFTLTGNGANIIFDVYEQDARNKLYEMMAYTDVLTGLKNKASFEKELDDLNQGLNRLGSIAILVFDLNNLKIVNDTYGHNEGDRLLHIAAELIEDHFNQIGRAFRVGGDEFTVIVFDKEKKEIEEAINQFNEKIIEKNNSDDKLKLSIAYGYGLYRKDEDLDFRAVFARADKEMYKCKCKQKEDLQAYSPF